MGNEIRGLSNSGTLYARVMDSEGRIYNGSSFETYNASNYSTYVINMVEQGNSQVYVADFPASITAGGTYEYFVHKQTGGTPSEGESVVTTGRVDWTGSTSVTAGAGAMTGSDWRDYVVGQGFKRTDKDTQLFEATTDQIQIVRRRFSFDEAQVEATSTDTVAVLGDFKIAIESDLGLMQGIVIEDGQNADRLVKKSKSEFDALYPDHNVSTHRGYPQHYTIFNSNIYFGPIPDDVSYSYRISYSRRAGTIVSSTTGVPFTDLYRDMLLEAVLSQLYIGLGEPEQALFHEQRFEQKFVECKRRERINSGAGTFTQEYRDC